MLYFHSTGKKAGSSKRFVALLACSFSQLIFDVLSVYTVNHLETVSPVVNRVIHIFYMGFLQVIFYIAYRYLETIIEEDLAGCVVLLTAFSDKSIIERAKRAGITAYLVKPVNPQMLLPSIEVAYAQSQLLRKSREETEKAKKKKKITSPEYKTVVRHCMSSLQI